MTAEKSGHILVRTHVRKRAQILKNSGGMSGDLKLARRPIFTMVFVVVKIFSVTEKIFSYDRKNLFEG